MRGSFSRVRGARRAPRAAAAVAAQLLAIGAAWGQPAFTITQITNATTGDSVAPSLSRGLIAFQSHADLTGSNPDGNSEIFLCLRESFEVPCNGSTILHITNSVTGDSTQANLRIDGFAPLAFSSTANLTGSNADGNREVFLSGVGPPTQITDTTSGDSTVPALEMGTIAFDSTADPTGGNPDGNSEIFYYDGSTILQITDSTSGSSRRPSLDGGAIAFESTADLTGGNPDGSLEIFLFDGSTILQITDSTSGISWLPSLDGGAIAFASNADLTGGNPDGGFEIFLFDGSTILQITDSPTLAQASMPTRGADGSLAPRLAGGAIAFYSSADLTGGNPDGNFEIFFFDGSAIHQVTDSTNGHSVSPSFDGGDIAFHSSADLTGGNPDGNSEIFLASRLPPVLEIPTAGPWGLAALALLLLAAGLVALRRAAA